MNATDDFFRPRTRDVLDPRKLWRDFTFHIDWPNDTVAVYFRYRVWATFHKYALDRAKTDIITDEIINWLRKTGRFTAYLMKTPVMRDIHTTMQMWHNTEDVVGIVVWGDVDE